LVAHQRAAHKHRAGKYRHQEVPAKVVSDHAPRTFTSAVTTRTQLKSVSNLGTFHELGNLRCLTACVHPGGSSPLGPWRFADEVDHQAQSGTGYVGARRPRGSRSADSQWIGGVDEGRSDTRVGLRLYAVRRLQVVEL